MSARAAVKPRAISEYDEEVRFVNEQAESAESSVVRGSRSSLGFHLQSEQGKFTKLPLDILPPAPKPPLDPVRNVPFLFTHLAKAAFFQSSPTPVPRPNSADFRKSRKERTDVDDQQARASPTWEKSGKKNSDVRQKLSHSSLDRVYSNKLGSGRTSAPPMMMANNESFLSSIAPAASSTFVGLRESADPSAFRTKKRVQKKTPDLFVLEAEQRAVEGEQKAAERQEFQRKKAELELYCTKLAAQYNDMRKTRVDMEKQFAGLQEQKAEVDAEEEGMHRDMTDSQKIQQMQDLEAKLDYWTQALREEESYTKTLMHMQTRSASDRHTREMETADFLKLTQNYDHDLNALVVRLQEAKNERAYGEKQVSDYMDQIDLYRERREVRLSQRKREVHKLQLKESALKRLIAQEEALNAQKNAINLAASQAALAAQRQKEAFYNALEEGFGKIMSVTGVQTVEELAECFIKREEKTGQFQSMLDAMKNRIDDLTTNKQDLEKQLLRIKFSGSGNDAESDEVEEVLQNLSKVRRRITERKMKLAALEALLIKVKSGFEYLASKLVRDLHMEKEGDQTTEKNGNEGARLRAERSLSPEGRSQSPDRARGQGEEDEETEEEAVRKKAMRKVDDPKSGVVALMNDCVERLNRVYRFLEVNTQGVPYQRLEDAEKVSMSSNVLLRLDESMNNVRVPLDQYGFLIRDRFTSADAPEEDATEEELDDRSSIKTKADRLVTKKKKELAARFDEFGNEIVPPQSAKTAEKKK